MPFFSLHKKILIVILVLTLVPLVLLTIYSTRNLSDVEKYLRKNATEALDNQASKALVLRAKTVASGVEQFLMKIEYDLRTLTLIPTTKENYLSFYNTHKKQIWTTSDLNKNGIKVNIPIYSEITLIGKSGMEIFKLKNGKYSTALRDVSDPLNTEYENEDYFNKAISLPPEQIYVSHLTGWHANRKENSYTGIIRFALAIRDSNKQFKSMIVLSLDHRHLMEFTKHISPTVTDFVMEPSYESGNYAFMFDDQGWIITHPKHWDIRGFDKNTKELVPPYSASSSKNNITEGNIPYNLLNAGFIHKNYPVVANLVQSKQSGVMDVTNIGGSKKIMAYAPILYSSGVYAEYGVFGGITIGAEAYLFHKPAIQISDVIKNELSRFALRSWLIVAIAILVVLIVGYRLSQSITKPLNDLIKGIIMMSKGDYTAQVEIKNNDEVGLLSTSFNTMAIELEARRQKLMDTIYMLNKSRDEIITEKNFNTILLENIEIGILTINNQLQISSINLPAKNLLKFEIIENNSSLDALFSPWPDLKDIIKTQLKEKTSTRWNDYITTQFQGEEFTLHVTILPFGQNDSKDIIVTIEDITKDVNNRTAMERMKRLASMGRLSAGLAHEIRNPLTGISIMLDDLHDRLLGKPDDQILIQKSLQEIERLENLVNELLDFTTNNSKIEINSLTEVLEDALIFVKKQCERANIDLIESIDSNLPQIKLDKSKIKQALLNIISNAIDSMPDGGKLHVTTKYVAPFVEICVEDNGIGISPEKLQIIFEPFYTSKGKGAGLGLAITHNIIADHNGHIDVTSSINKGSIFKLQLPVTS